MVSIGLDRNRPGSRDSLALGVLGPRVAEQLERIPAGLGQDQDRQDRRGRHQHHGLDDLHPRRGQHAARDDVDQHERAGEDHRQLEADSDQRFDQHTRTDHLRNQVEGHHAQRSECGGGTRRPFVHAERQHVGDRVLARVAHALREQEEHRQKRHEEADRVQEAVEPEQEDQARDPEERCGRHVVARDGEAVLSPGDAPARRPEVGCRRDTLGRPVRDQQRDRDDPAEDPERQLVEVCGEVRHRTPTSAPLPRTVVAAGGRVVLTSSALCAARSASGSNSRSALRRYHHASPQVITNWDRAST